MRAIVDDEYADAPVDEPGNDDLGAISSWYVWGALGLFPVTPGSADIGPRQPALPFRDASRSPTAGSLVEHAPRAAASRPYVHALTVSGVTRADTGGRLVRRLDGLGWSGRSQAWTVPWLPASVLKDGATLDLLPLECARPGVGVLSSEEPTVVRGGLVACRRLLGPEWRRHRHRRATGDVRLGARLPVAGTVSVAGASRRLPAGVSVTPSSGVLVVPGEQRRAAAVWSTRQATVALSIAATAAGTFPVRFGLGTPGGTELPPVVLDVTRTAR